MPNKKQKGKGGKKATPPRKTAPTALELLRDTDDWFTPSASTAVVPVETKPPPVQTVEQLKRLLLASLQGKLRVVRYAHHVSFRPPPSIARTHAHVIIITRSSCWPNGRA